ncbi:hypothetical protein Tco_1169917, partial [Tanacetum coccineum]
SNDEGKYTLVVEGSDLSYEIDTADTTQNMYQEEGVTATQIDDNNIYEDNRHSVSTPGDFRNMFQPNEVQTPGPRRSSRQSKLNDYMVNSSVRYGIEKFVCYSV